MPKQTKKTASTEATPPEPLTPVVVDTPIVSPDDIPWPLITQALLKGASPQGAAMLAGVDPLEVQRAIAPGGAAADLYQQTLDLLSGNVLAALYQNAMKGQPAAQQFWLKLRPPVGWTVPTTESSTLDWETLSDAELWNQCGLPQPRPAAGSQAGTDAA